MKFSRIFSVTLMIGMLTATSDMTFGQLHGHIHVGVNENNQLFIIESLDAGPDWNTVNMYLQEDFVSGIPQFYEADLCWNSARVPDGSYHLGNPEGGENAGGPDWNINMKRITFPNMGNFSAYDKTTTNQILPADGDSYEFWSRWREFGWPNENGDEGTWRFHDHRLFKAMATPGEIFTATFTVFDDGSSGYLESEEFTLNFVAVVPEPMTVGLLGFGGLMALRRRK